MSTPANSHGYSMKATHLVGRGFEPPPASLATPVVFVVADEVALRESLELLIRREGWQPEAFPSAQEFLARPRALVPNCLVLDVSLAEFNGLDLQRRLSIERPDMSIISIACQIGVPTTAKAMKAGAVECFTKPFRDDLLLAAIREALERSRFALEHEAEIQVVRSCFASLTPRERQVMNLLIAGLLNKQVGGELGISEHTVKVHRGRVMQKMQADSFAQLVRMAAKIDIATRPESITPSYTTSLSNAFAKSALARPSIQPAVFWSVSDTARCIPWAEPGAADVIFVPNWTEHPEPGGVNWTTRKPLSKPKSASRCQPSFV